MNLLLVTNQFPKKGGDSIFIEEEWKVLSKEFNHIVLVSRSKSQKVDVELPQNVTLYWYNGPNLISIIRLLPRIFSSRTRIELKKAKNCSIKNYIKRFLDIVRFRLVELDFEGFVKNIELQKDTIAYTYWISGATLALLNQRERLGFNKVVSRTHGAELYNERCKGGWQPFRDIISEELDEIYFACEYGRKYFIRQWGNINNKVREVAYLGSVTPQENHLINATDDKKIVLLSCSRIISLKRIELIIQALELIPDSLTLEWRHLGDGIEKNNIIKLSHEKLDKKKNVTWFIEGYLPHEELEAYYSKHGVNLFITTSSTEGGTPISMIEALSMGVPVIGTSVGGITEIIHDSSCGFLLSDNPTPQEICGAICEYSETGIDMKNMLSRNAFSRWKEYYVAEDNAHEFVQKLVKSRN